MNRAVFFPVVLLFTTASLAQTGNWPGFRGAHSDGLAEGVTLPEEWSETENVVWKTDIPGWGWSSPIVWGDRVFVTSAVGENELAKPVIGGYPGGHVKQTDVHRFMTYCLDVDSGRIIWEREAHRGVPPEERHPKNSYANATPVTDGHQCSRLASAGPANYWVQRTSAVWGDWGGMQAPFRRALDNRKKELCCWR